MKRIVIFDSSTNWKCFSEIKADNSIDQGDKADYFTCKGTVTGEIIFLRKENCMYRANLADFSDNQCVTCFQESAELIPGTRADELGDTKIHHYHGKKKSRLWLNKPKQGGNSQNSPQYKISPKPQPAKMHHSSSPGSSKKHSCSPQKSITLKKIRTLAPMKHSPASFSANDNTTLCNPEDDDTTIVNEKTTTCTQIYNGTSLQEKMIQDSYFVHNRPARTIRLTSICQYFCISKNEATYDQTFQDAMFKSYIFRLRAMIETYNDESRLKAICLKATPVVWAEQSRRLIEDIEK